jgi:hypothetical protein
MVRYRGGGPLVGSAGMCTARIGRRQTPVEGNHLFFLPTEPNDIVGS